MSARYAIYFAPAQDSPWWSFGSHWLGRNARSGAALAQPLLADLPAAELQRITEAPRGYGFHATLKAPFRLAVGCSETMLRDRLQALAQTQRPVALHPMQVARLGDFVAIVPRQPSAELLALAGLCVTDLDDLRAPLSATELARRRIAPQDTRALELLARYGYPHVLERFRLHFTLCGPLDDATAQRVLAATSAPVAQLNAVAPLWLDRLCLFVEPEPGAPFQCRAECPLVGG